MIDHGACFLCGLVGDVGAELEHDGAGFKCANERRCAARQLTQLTEGWDDDGDGD